MTGTEPGGALLGFQQVPAMQKDPDLHPSHRHLSMVLPTKATSFLTILFQYLKVQ